VRALTARSGDPGEVAVTVIESVRHAPSTMVVEAH
jgi:hypothetical protein